MTTESIFYVAGIPIAYEDDRGRLQRITLSERDRAIVEETLMPKEDVGFPLSLTTATDLQEHGARIEHLLRAQFGLIY
jgi:hypothetical protein